MHPPVIFLNSHILLPPICMGVGVKCLQLKYWYAFSQEKRDYVYRLLCSVKLHLVAVWGSQRRLHLYVHNILISLNH